MKKIILFLLIVTLEFILPLNNVANNFIKLRIVGSNTLYPFSSLIAENFGVSSIFQTPIIESTGTGGGINLFCRNYNRNTPSIASATRKMTLNEKKFCKKNKITPIEILLGYNGIVISGSKNSKPLKLKSDHLFKALASHVLKEGKVIINPYTHWNDIDEKLPKSLIKILGPPSTSGIYDTIIKLVIQPFCSKKLNMKGNCGNLRNDGAYKAANDHGNIIAKKLNIDHKSIGIFGYNFLQSNKDLLWGASINNIKPTIKNIATDKYFLSHPFYLYIKKEHLNKVLSIIPFTEFFLNENISGEYTLIANKGLIPLDLYTRQIQNKYLKANKKTN